MSKAYISSINLYGGYSANSKISGSFGVNDPDTGTTSSFTVTEEEGVRFANLMWDIVDARKHEMAEAVSTMRRPLLVDHSDSKTIDNNDDPHRPF